MAKASVQVDERSGARRTGAAPAKLGPKRPIKRKSPLWARLLIVFGSLLVMASGGALVGSMARPSRVTGGSASTLTV